ncbi:hypothetical protein CBFG_00636 [Clostridiales bacterium 1_7_47FAA]|nr:hypothetical protein CBFG_00636 [Clostridiales bacterium 1_7_47FAA]
MTGFQCPEAADIIKDFLIFLTVGSTIFTFIHEVVKIQHYKEVSLYDVL